jgi:predicted DNA-binding transcriptional regulator AlpA
MNDTPNTTVSKDQTPSLTLRITEVIELIGGGVSIRSIYRWIENGYFPKPLTIGGRSLWRRSDVIMFIQEADGSMKKFKCIKGRR